MSCQTITRQTNVCVGGQIVKAMECTLFQGICIPNKDELLQPGKTERHGFIVQTAAVCAFYSKASQFRGQCVGREVLSHASLLSCLI